MKGAPQAGFRKRKGLLGSWGWAEGAQDGRPGAGRREDLASARPQEHLPSQSTSPLLENDRVLLLFSWHLRGPLGLRPGMSLESWKSVIFPHEAPKLRTFSPGGGTDQGLFTTPSSPLAFSVFFRGNQERHKGPTFNSLGKEQGPGSSQSSLSMIPEGNTVEQPQTDLGSNVTDKLCDSV